MVEKVFDEQQQSDAPVLHISAEEYMAHYAEQFYEWVGGVAIKRTPVSETHDFKNGYLYSLLSTYLELPPIGVLHSAPFLMRMDAIDARREPDLMVLLNEHRDRLTPTYLNGAADLCIEIVSSESVARDYGDKFSEYERAGVTEYWIIDPLRKETRFLHLTDAGHYATQSVDENGFYACKTLPGLKLHVPTLWLDPLPGPVAIVAAVQQMLTEP